jgi:hypothetical protein
MEIIVGNTVHINKDPDNSANKIKQFILNPFKNRRKNRADRRKSYREGVFVSLSCKKDRRGIQDRRMG